MKKNLKLIISSLLMISSFQIVKATTSCDSINLIAKPGEFNLKSNYLMYYSNGTNPYNFDIYTLTDANNNKYVAYCQNAGLCASNEECQGAISTTQKFTCEKKIFDPNEEVSTIPGMTIKAYEKGIVEIIQSGYKNNGASTYENYVSSNIALRTFELMWPSMNENSNNNNHKLNKVMKYYANIWINDSAFRVYAQEINTFLGANTVQTTDFPTVNNLISWNNDNALTKQIQEQAYNYLKKAFEASLDYLKNGAATLTWNEKPIKTKAPTKEVNGVTYYETMYTYNFKVENFNSSKASIKMNFECPDCQKYNLDYEIYVNDSEHKTAYKNISSLDFINYVKKGNGNIQLDIVFSGNSKKYNCDEIDYKLNINYFDDTISTEAYKVQDADCRNCQSFFVLYATDVAKTASIEGTAELCTLSCTDLEKLCDNGNIDACTKFKEIYNEDCAECTTYIGNAECSEEDSEIDINEGYDIDSNKCNNINEDNNLNVLQCVINGKDAADNSYKATSEGFEKVSSNEFCTVWCKEDYHIVLPGIKEANSGRYFSLKASIKGTKTCYTSKIDENNTFKDKLDEKRKAVIDAWNTWNKWYQGLYGNYEDEDITHHDSDYSCNKGHWESDTCYRTDANGNTTTYSCRDYVCDDRCDCSIESNGYRRSWTYEKFDYFGGTKEVNTSDSRDGGYAKCSCHSGSKKDGSISNIRSAIAGDLSKAETKLKSAINAYTKLINDYNACSGVNTYSYDIKLKQSKVDGWKMEYEYEPIVSFWYEESYMNSVLTDRLETKGKIDVGNVKQNICEVDTNKSYKQCNSGWKKSVDTENKVSQFVCKKSGSKYTCNTEDIIISKAKYVKQEMTAEGEYITPTQFYTIYPTGAIVVAEEGENIENSKELTNLLPVGLGTTQGVYNYTITISNLGEYYNKGKLGRIWGDKNSVVVNVLEKAEEEKTCIKEGALTNSVKIDNKNYNNGVYVCAYKVNCPDCPVECDESGCKNSNCPTNGCPVECDKCVYTNGSTNIIYKPISPGNINPSDRELGVNWKYDKNSISTALELKAYATTQEIEEKGETIYDVDYKDASTNVDRDFAIHIKLDSKMINKIREYNDKYENNGGYANNTLKCYDYEQDGKKYENIYCYSTFIDELLYDNSTKNNIQIVGNRIIGTDAESSDNLRSTQTQTSSYWTTWAQANSSKWTITTQNGLSYYKKNYSEIGIGPSWK